MKSRTVAGTLVLACGAVLTAPGTLARREALPVHSFQGGGAAAPDFDLVVIGGGSGGIACASEAVGLGAKVAVLDFVTPSPKGTTWGLGGTCVNVGCIPKKLMHHAAQLGEGMEHGTAFGWEGVPPPRHCWGKLVSAVQDHIKKSNFYYRTALRQSGVLYLNERATLTGPRTVQATAADGSTRVLTAAKIVIAVGGRPNALAVPGGELAISSDDLFSLQSLTASEKGKKRSKVLVVGGSYVALECAGFLQGLGHDASVLYRSVLLRGFDSAMAVRVGEHMAARGTTFIGPADLKSLEKTASGRIKATWTQAGVQRSKIFDAVLSAVGRTASTASLGLDHVGVEVVDGTGKIVCDEHEQTTAADIFAVGDVVQGVPELSPTAVQAGRLLARRLFGGEDTVMDYSTVCTTVFTPLECVLASGRGRVGAITKQRMADARAGRYSCCGLTEEEAVAAIGEEGVEVYHAEFQPLEEALLERDEPQPACYCKAVCDGAGKVLGLHFAGPHAGEVMQGFGVAMKLGLRMDDLRRTVGIHPTSAEELTNLRVSKRSNAPTVVAGC